MGSVASRGTTDRITARILFKVPRAGSGTRARYSSMFFGADLRPILEPTLREAALLGLPARRVRCVSFIADLFPPRPLFILRANQTTRRPSRPTDSGCLAPRGRKI